MERSGYNSDVSDKQRERLQEYLPAYSGPLRSLIPAHFDHHG